MTDDQPLLAYAAPTTPSPLAISVAGSEPSKGALTVEVTNSSETERLCNTITLALALGEGGSHFTPVHKAGDIKISHSPGWAVDWEPDEPGTATASPNDEGSATVRPGSPPLFFELSNIAVNAQEGNAELSIEEDLEDIDGSRVASTVLICPKGPSGLALHDFRPLRQVVPTTEDAELVWQFEPAPDAKVELEYFDAGTGRSKTVDVTAQRNHRVRLYQDTRFALHAYTGDKDAPTFDYWLSTFVTVAEPYLTTSDLTVTGALSLLARPPAHPPQLELTPPPTTKTVRKQLDFRAETDGLLTATLRTFFKHTNAKLTVTVEPPNAPDTRHVAQIYCDGPLDKRIYAPGPNLAVPVPKDSTVTVKWDLIRTSGFTHPKNTFLFATDLRWHPFGVGDPLPL
ncbi:hypothetical protein [Kitasatospora sp. CB02891]|uniref:hypothetical protein n=1 Tax=Kitasatospora sp. CB02891 TaxID=2020329 RepID=UPI000C27E7BA|nr:hypothetical protein [Kitasatospora sp. CB02891]PJN27773.1 hypothetical protein CG736_06055 [Kitasatospora sp. CB02891]